MLIYEKKDIEVKELFTAKGHYETNPLESFFSEFISSSSKKERNKLFKKYYVEKLGYDISKIDDISIEQYFEYLGNNVTTKPNFPRKFWNYDTISGLSYFVAKKFYKIKSGGFGLEYIKTDSFLTSKSFYFFDSALEIFVGKIVVSRVKGDKNLKGYVFKIDTSAAERKLIGMGYGTKMYMTILEYCDFLMSDTVLYEGSFRIWSSVLPSIANTWYFTGKKFKKIISSADLPKSPDKIEYFVASMYHKKI